MSLGIRNFAERKKTGTKDQHEDFSRNLLPHDEDPRLRDVKSIIPVNEPDRGEQSSYEL